MSSRARRTGSTNKSSGDSSNRPGSTSRKTEAENIRPGSGNRKIAGVGVKNKSNSATVSDKGQHPDSVREISPAKVGNLDGKIKVLGQDAEMTEAEIWNLNGVSSGKTTPMSGRGSTGKTPLRPDSSHSYRTPTPSKQISLQAVRRKEEKTDPIETIDWNDFVRPVSRDDAIPPTNFNDRIPSPRISDSEDSDKDSGFTMEDRLIMVEKRAQQMTSALSSHPLTDLEEDLAKQLDKVELEREKNETLEKRQEYESVENRERQNNESFRDFQISSPKPIARDSEIVGANSQTNSISKPGTSRETDNIAQSHGVSLDDEYPVGARPKILNRENISQEFSMNKEPRAVSESTDEKKESSDSKTKSTSENAGDSSTSDDSDDDEEEDLIGQKGKTPNQLLLEFLDCIMTEDYVTAEKLCKMILIYEPENPEALSFYPLIQEKIKQEEEESEDDSESDNEDEDDDDDDDEDDEDDDEDDDDDDDDEDNEEESSSEESEEEQRVVPDSGVASANSD